MRTPLATRASATLMGLATLAVVVAVGVGAWPLAAQQRVPGRNQIERLDGSATRPSDTYERDTDLGCYRIGADNEGCSAGGTLRWDYNTSRLKLSSGYSLLFNATDINETDAAKIDGITNGTAAAGKALVADANVDITAGLRYMTLSSLTIAGTTTSSNGVIWKGGSSFFHTYFAPGSDGANTFAGVGAGNFSMGPGGGAAYLGSYNTAFGYNALNGVTTGFNNTGFGENTLKVTTTGSSNTALGAGAMIGNDDGQDNVAVGTAALYGNTTGDYNVAVGPYAGYIDGTNKNTSGRFNTWVGWGAGPSSSTQRDGTIAIGYGVQPTADYQAMIGDASVTTTVLRGLVQWGGTTSSYPAWKRSSAELQARLADDSADASIVTKSVRGTAVTFTNVPGSPVEGMLVAVTDSTTATWGATITGGGSNHVLAYYNGTNWTVAGK